MRKRSILHILSSEKFTNGYIDCMRQFMSERIEHRFAFYDFDFSRYKMSPPEGDDLILLADEAAIVTDEAFIQAADASDLLIVSGFFSYAYFTQLLPQYIKDKLFIQFWGGDFYCLRTDSASGPNTLDAKFCGYLRRRSMEECAGLLFLIDGEYEKFNEITGINKKHYVVPMPSEISSFSFQRYRDENIAQKTSGARILLGNSASETNLHEEALELLSRYNDIEILCPLSYGDERYRDIVIKKGRDLFGDKFIPIVDFMEFDDYVKILSTCDAGIFNLNRQQALGNIGIMLSLGKKVYLRKGTSMWNYFIDHHYSVFPIDIFSELNESELTYISEDLRVNNINLAEREYLSNDNMITLWCNFLRAEGVI